MNSRRGQEARARLGQTFGEMSYNVLTLCLRGMRLTEWETRYPRNIRRIIGPFPRQIGSGRQEAEPPDETAPGKARFKTEGRQGGRATSFLYIYL